MEGRHFVNVKKTKEIIYKKIASSMNVEDSCYTVMMLLSGLLIDLRLYIFLQRRVMMISLLVCPFENNSKELLTDRFHVGPLWCL